MSIQSAIDTCVDAAIERRDFEQALRMRWLSHANDNATYEPFDIIDYLQQLRLVTGKTFPTLRT